MNDDRYNWWNSLKHGGVLIAPSKLAEFFPDPPAPTPPRQVEQLRRDLTRLEAGADGAERALLGTVLESLCGLGDWKKGNDVGTEWTQRTASGEAIKPRWLWQGSHGACLPVFVDTGVPRIGVGRGRRSVSRILAWLRGADRKLALITNLRQWRLIYAGLDFDAWAEWDTDLWLEEGEAGPQVAALRALFSPQTLNAPAKGEPGPLLAAIQASRKGQAELSQELGERVRRAVELLIQAHGPAIEELVNNKESTAQAVYIAATRIIMRMVVILFAEARDLLPRDNRIYHASYGMQGLREELERAGSGAARTRLRHRYGAWPRILSLFRLVYEGSHHGALPIPRYGGDLFAPGDAAGSDPVSKAIAVLEDPERAPNDEIIHSIFRNLCHSRVKVRQGRGATWIDAPVDFSDLSSEYIGILYEGLLDFELRQAGRDDPMVFLALGDEPVLPLSRLEAMEDKDLKNLVEKLKVSNRKKAASSEEGEDDSEETEEETDEESDQPDEEQSDSPEAENDTASEIREEADSDERRAATERAVQWARHAVITGKLVAKPRTRNAASVREYEDKVNAQANQLIRRIMLPGEWFLVRWGGTRKGAGTFYTRPQLAVPTTRRTLEPLVYQSPSIETKGDQTDNKATPEPKPPEEILAIKVCDPAMGSGSFLVAALRYLTDALYTSLMHHDRIRPDGDRSIIKLIAGEADGDSLAEELLPCPPEADDFEPRLRALLKRYVVERCIYGVDFDPLAVELGRLALWVETMDRDLPFEFLDHKLKCGNSLVGCWFDRFRDYPALAWEREGGDKNHSNGVHFKKEAWTKAIKEVRKQVKQELPAWVVGQRGLLDTFDGKSVENIHADAIKRFEQLHRVPVQNTEERSSFYRDHIQQDPAVLSLRQAFDTWTACWFWPAEELNSAPSPTTFERLSEESQAIVQALAREYRFFHWEIEFPDVFDKLGAGFSAIAGNPPWDIQKPSSKEYFSNFDPLYRTYGKQEALREQTKLFEQSEQRERDWLRYNAHFKALSNWCKNSGSPFGDGEHNGNTFSFGRGHSDIHPKWASQRTKHKGFADPNHPYIHQGSADINTYKMFLEFSHALLASGGQLGMIAPSGLYTDKGTTELRRLFVEHCRWRWLFGFENREGIFDIHRSFKFGPVILEKGGETDAIQTAFMHRRLEDWEDAENFAIPYSRQQVLKFSPKTRAILEIRHQRDLEILEKIYENSVLLGDTGPDGWGIKYATEFHMTNDSKLFKPRPWWEERGYKPDPYGRWIRSDGDVALPLYQGVMIWQYDLAAKMFPEGGRNNARWQQSESWPHEIRPKFLMSQDVFKQNAKIPGGCRLGFRDLSNPTNRRTMIAAILPPYPCGNKVPIFSFEESPVMFSLAVLGMLNSITFDFILRQRFSVSAGAGSLNPFILNELPLPAKAKYVAALASLTMRLSLGHPALSVALLSVVSKSLVLTRPAYTPHERLRIACMVDAIVAALYGLDWQDFQWIVRDCAMPVEQVTDRKRSKSFDPKGFWRLDKERPPQLRLPLLALAALKDLGAMIESSSGDRLEGIDKFCNLNDGEGWMVPETLCVADLGLGHGKDAQHPQSVRNRLGPRFYDWQLEQSPEESWAECERHARYILGEREYTQLSSRGWAAGLTSDAESRESQGQVREEMSQRNLL